MSAKVSQLNSVKDFLDISGRMLYADETVNNLILGVSETLIRFPDAYKNPFIAVVKADDGDVILAALMTPPHNMILAGDESYQAGVEVLVTYLHENPLEIPGVIGPAPIAVYFAAEWKRVMKKSSMVSMRQKVYELRIVQMFPFPPGEFRQATTDDIPIIAEWLQSFEEEALGKPHDIELARTERLIKLGSIFVWEIEGDLVSMAMRTRPIAHSITIGGVYTPFEYRHKGYATGLVAMLSQRLLDSGYEFVNLFTDLANPTSNSIYQKIGYRPVCDFRMYSFVD